MNTNKTIINARPVGGDYFRLINVNISTKYLSYYINLFDPNDYYILKASAGQRIVSYEDLLEFKYSGYIFFRKDLYNINQIMDWVEYFINLGGRNNGILYLHKPTPPFSPNKIIVRQ